ncbi:MAG: arginine N-succinyltransferase [Paludibacterium sp.]|uniref:arginine N-succinyltransferase n=1 Tax=Paludibacterium sp. TaxID=1917523 RepID=UPI0025E218E2|nr:arginine N-succinyltransferase [Paludibacterium sp.]MBV8049116.1 arginine N-succinyltransferase [Paludibacterium sp.]MBV8649785.1 arginine N-succinyltransferase [Paludibacterium sp.]
MMIIRPIERNDLARFMALAEVAGVGMTSLPADEEWLAERIDRSVKSFAGELPQIEQGFIFVLEDTEHDRIAGTCAMEAAVGLKTPWYNYRIGTVVHASEELGVYKRHDALFLSNDHTGFTELCSLFMHPDYRAHRVGSLLSKSRLLFLAQFPDLFSDIVVAELRGVSDEAGQSPFWEGLGRHFFSMDFSRADTMTGLGEKTFVAELMPKHPIYIELLPEAAQAVIREPHPDTKPALKMLNAEGFRCEGYVDIFDGGPTVQAYAREIRAVRESRLSPVRVVPAASGEGERLLVCNTAFADFRVIVAYRAPGEQDVALSAEQAAALGVAEGDKVRCVPLSPTRRPGAE